MNPNLPPSLGVHTIQAFLQRFLPREQFPVYALLTYNPNTKTAWAAAICNSEWQAQEKAMSLPRGQPNLILNAALNPIDNWDKIALWLCDLDLYGLENLTAQRQLQASLQQAAKKTNPFDFITEPSYGKQLAEATRAKG